ncbi:hypothetical protein PPACK8108_LOCUS23990 [Phakopsora pachyrhizi]|uniref:Uncharacterized protein n=1 Tax=Phakopsora pachyrhizi TaxID=170000 RepID=A0AAV0BRF1_PHAPC|nr:hypothetical protein PPACK8108_LOCUS23990 [Phakopsora pachyrhizi]
MGCSQYQLRSSTKPLKGYSSWPSHHNVQRVSEPSAYPIVINKKIGAGGAQSHPFMSQSSNVTQSHPPKKSFADFGLSDSDHADDALTGFLEIKPKLISLSMQANKPSVHFEASPHSTHNHIAINNNLSLNQPILPLRVSSFDTQPQHTLHPKQVLSPYLPVVDTAPTNNQLLIAMDTESQHFDSGDVSFAQSSVQEPSSFEMAEDEQTMFFSPSASFRDFPQILSHESLDKVRKRPQIAC